MKPKIVLLFFCSVALAFPALPARAQEAAAPSGKTRTEPVYGTWHASTIGDGGYHQHVVLCPTNPWRYYTYIDTGGIFRSDDAGETWKLITAGMVPRPYGYDTRSLAVDPRNEDIVLAATSDLSGIYRSTDGGNNWRGVLPHVPFHGNGPFKFGGPLIVFQPGHPDTVLAASQGAGLFKSSDGGQTWIKKGLENLYATGVLFDASNSQCAWICAVAATTRWNPVGTYGGGLYYTSDAGETWQKVSESSPVKMVQDPANPDTLYGISPDVLQVCVSRDRGKTWADFNEGLKLAPGPVQGKEATSDGRYRSIEAGPDFLLCGSARGTIYRLDQGQTAWSPVKLEEVDYDGSKWLASEHPGGWPPDQFGRGHGFGSATSNLLVDPHDPDHWILTDWYAIYQSHDAGHRWQLTIAGIESTAILCLKQDPTDANQVYLNMSDNGYFYSHDGGLRFAKPAIDFPSADVKCTDLSPRKPERVWATGNKEGGNWAANQLFVSLDRGATWKKAAMDGLPNPGASSRPPEPPDLNAHRFEVVTVAPESPDTIYVAASGETTGPGQGGVYRTVDGGTTWSWFGEGLSGKVFSDNFWTYDNQFVIHPDGTALLYGAAGKAVFRLDGEKWASIGLDTGGKTVRIAADWHRPGTFYLGLSGKGIYFSRDGGATWNLLHPFTGAINSLETDHAQAGRVAFSSADTVFYSADDGKTWADLDPKHLLPCVPAKCMAFAGDRLFFGTHNCGAYWTALP